MKKSAIFYLLIITLSILVFAGCGSAPKSAPITAPASTPEPAQEAKPAVEQPGGLVLEGAANYTVVRGDTLADIAARRYGGSNMYYFPLIRLGNAVAVPDPDEIEVGTNLLIPDLQRNLGNNGARALIKQDMLNIAAQYERQRKPNAAARLRSLSNSL